MGWTMPRANLLAGRLGVGITTLVTKEIVKHGAGQDNLVHSLQLQVDFCYENTPAV